MIDAETFIQLCGRLTLAILMASMVIAFVRLVIGPRAADRIVALDLISILIVAFLAAYAFHAGDKSFLDVAIAYALVAFLGTVALSRFLMRSRNASAKTKGTGSHD